MNVKDPISYNIENVYERSVWKDSNNLTLEEEEIKK
jgi:hypothetical protein